MDWGAARTLFIERSNESSARVEGFRNSYIYAHKIQNRNSFQAPTKATQAPRAEYYNDLQKLGLIIQGSMLK